MSARPSFMAEAAIGLALSLAAAALAASGGQLLADAVALRGTVALIGLGYVLIGLARSRVHVGRIVAACIWAVGAALVWLLAPAWPVYLGVHVGLIWLARAAFMHRSPLAALVDLALCVLALAVAAWAFMRTGSVLLAAWCFFLVQALHTAIPTGANGSGSPLGAAKASDPGVRFARAQAAAEGALRRISST